MMGIFDDKVETISAEAQMRPFNLAQLSHMITTFEQCKQGFNESSVTGLVAGHAEAPNEDRLQYPSTPKDFQTFEVIVEMADAYNIFSRCMYFNPEMSDTGTTPEQH